MKKVLFIVGLLVASLTNAQEVLNNYKYVVIPVRYDFQKTEDQYQLNSLLKHKFNQLGLEAYLDTDDLPKEAKTNSCAYLKPIINAKSNMFTTKTTIDLVDCDKNVVYSSIEGVSKSKSIRASYLESVRAALKSFDGFQYSYEAKQAKNPIVENSEINIIINSKDPQGDNVLISDKVQKEIEVKRDKRISLTHTANYIFKGEKYGFMTVIDGLFYKNIVKKGTGVIIGSLSKSSKKGIYHVILNNKKGVGYYDENGSFLVEIMNGLGEIQLHKFSAILTK